MTIDLSHSEVVGLLESLEYSKDRVRNALGTPPSVRKENLTRLESIADRLQTLRRQDR